MKLIIKYVGKRTRLVIEVDPEEFVYKIKKDIELKFRLADIGFRLLFEPWPKLKIILTDSFPLKFFNITNGSLIEIDAYGYSKLLRHKKSLNSTYLDKIGISLSYKILEQTEFDDLINICRRGDTISFIRTAEFLIKKYPEEDMLNQTHQNLWSCLHHACYYGYADIIKYLALKQVNVNRVTVDEWTPLQLASYMNNLQCIVNLSAHKNLQYNKMTKFRGTPLHLACEKNQLETVKLLIAHDALVSVKDPLGRTPFDLTTEPEILNLLAITAGQEELKRCSIDRPEALITKVWLSEAFYIHDRNVVLYLNPCEGYLHRYRSIETYQEKSSPELSIKIKDIQDVREENSWFSKEDFYFVVETSKSSSWYYTKSLELTQEWILRLQNAANYSISHTEEYEIASPTRLRPENTDQPAVTENAPVSDEELSLSSFETVDELGNGSFGTVYKVLKFSTNDYYAMKVLSKSTLQRERQLKYAISEIKIMKKLKHPFILKLHYAFQNLKNIYLILDYCENGDLYKIIQNKKRLDERTARFYLSEVILALEYLHSMDILYRDLKPSNILLDREGHVKIADFGLAKENVNSLNPAMTIAGTPAYLPPETLDQRGTSKPADIYGLGALLYEMITGETPFNSISINEIFSSIRQAQLSFPPYISKAAKDFIISTMSKLPEKRPNINAVKHYAFFKKLDWDALLAKKIRPPKIMKNTGIEQEENFF